MVVIKNSPSLLLHGVITSGKIEGIENLEISVQPQKNIIIDGCSGVVNYTGGGGVH